MKDDFLETYKRHVEIEASAFMRQLIEDADYLDYSRCSFIEDVIQELHKLKKEVEE